ncbi:MAG: NAD(P)H-binding protein [Firmicutes bacterium]|jgi:NADH dehydrogenase|nr:NAD(P)H-binding protein [Bacillota bacterium]MCL5014095.1 NAD(P)H-binding protein [Bacillota bacterium]
MRVLLTGGTGYVGQAVQRALIHHGHDVTVLARHSHGLLPGVQFEKGDIRHVDLGALLADINVVVHLVGIIEEHPATGVTFDVMHYQVTKRLVDAMTQHGLGRLIHMSALGTRASARSHYHQSKWKAEEFVRHSNIGSIILRPSLLFGGGAPFFMMVRNQCRLPVVPVPADGETLLQPVARADVAELIARLVTTEQYWGQTWEVGGTKRFTMNELYRHVAATQGRRHVPLLHVPLGILFPMARLGENLPGFPITVDQLMMLNEPNITDDTRWHQVVEEVTPLDRDF